MGKEDEGALPNWEEGEDMAPIAEEHEVALSTIKEDKEDEGASSTTPVGSSKANNPAAYYRQRLQSRANALDNELQFKQITSKQKLQDRLSRRRTGKKTSSE